MLGMKWNRLDVTIKLKTVSLNNLADTKRQVLQSLNSIYDVLNIYCPLLLRAKLFLQSLAHDESVTWDSTLSRDHQRLWGNICKQLNSAPQLEISRFIGSYNSSYELYCFTDASRDAYGCVIYIRDRETSSVSFLCSKNRILSKNYELKTIPSLELLAMCFGAETLFNVYTELTGGKIEIPVSVCKLYLFTDSMVALSWLESYSVKFGKTQKLSVFVRNRLQNIDKICEKMPITFSHIAGEENPADCCTRPLSYRKLKSTCYLSGPKFIDESDGRVFDAVAITVPSPVITHDNKTHDVQANSCTSDLVRMNHVVGLNKFSHLSKLVRVTLHVMNFVKILKSRVAQRSSPGASLEGYSYSDSLARIILIEQKQNFPEVFEFFVRKSPPVSSMPNLISQLNLFIDENGFIRVKCKFSKGFCPGKRFPLLLPKNSYLTTLIVRHYHEKVCHAGMHSVLKEIRNEFWIPQCYSLVRRVLRSCTVCRRFNARPIVLNQNSYREWRSDPPRRVFASVFLDYAGPFQVDVNGNRKKVYLLIITCLWSRAINILVCQSLDVKDFLRAVQIHIYSYGIFESCMADSGSQLVAGFNIVRNFLDDSETSDYLNTHNIRKLEFSNYCKGNSALGSLVESCVKQTKRLLQKSIRNCILDYFDFELTVFHIVHVLNRRPVAFKESLRNPPVDDVPTAISPEMLLYGRELPSVVVLPELIKPSEDPDYNPEMIGESVANRYDKIQSVRARLVEAYQSEFLANLVIQATDKKKRFVPKPHSSIKPNDVVLLKDNFVKANSYPLAVVREVVTNSLGEVSSAVLMKGGTRELVTRHVSSLILLVPYDACEDVVQKLHSEPNVSNVRSRPLRSAADASTRRTRSLFSEGLV